MQSINIHTDNGIEWIQWASENEIDDVGYSRQYGEIVSYVVELNKSSILKAQEFLQSNTEPTRVFRRQFILSHATLADSSNRR